MNGLIRMFICLCVVYNPLFAASIDTFYGTFIVEEPVLIELIESPAFQRLIHIHQYGVSYYTTHREEFNRYEHSLGVFALLCAKNCSLDEQIAGLLHDVSHTVFSHVGDKIFNRNENEMDYQNLTYVDYLERTGLDDILRKYGFSAEAVQPKQEFFPALEQSLPSLCADRIDYNLQGAFYQGFLTKEEALRFFQESQFIDGDWISQDFDLLKKIVRYTLYASKDFWGSGTGYVLSKWLSEAIQRGLALEIITEEDIRFGVDQEIWDCLVSSNDSQIQATMYKIFHYNDYHQVVDEGEGDLLVVSKFRGVDPWVIVDGKKVRLTSTDPILENEFQSVKALMAKGWSIKLFEPEISCGAKGNR